MLRKQLNVRLPQTHIDRLDAMRNEEGLSQAEMLMRLIDERWVVDQLEAHLERLYAATVRIESTFAEPKPAVVYDDDENAPPF